MVLLHQIQSSLSTAAVELPSSERVGSRILKVVQLLKLDCIPVDLCFVIATANDYAFFSSGLHSMCIWTISR